MEVVYEDNHIIIVSKQSGEIVQGDKTGDRPLSEMVKDYIKEKYASFRRSVPGSGSSSGSPRIRTRSSLRAPRKALTRLNKMFAEGEVHKTYWAIVEKIGG